VVTVSVPSLSGYDMTWISPGNNNSGSLEYVTPEFNAYGQHFSETPNPKNE